MNGCFSAQALVSQWASNREPNRRGLLRNSAAQMVQACCGFQFTSAEFGFSARAA